ncbi:MAG: flavodoxin family protein [Lachnospiraceae bacterium]|nr:flavodoxin family protein [Lachnospiraceae bacterium]MDD3615502.1 flavodoxin family protein [Lachnospiraceae bacterium]
MKVLLINGSPHEKGCTYTALHEVEMALQKNGVETEIYHIGIKPVRGCIACGACQATGKCAFNDDPANEILDLMKEADGVVIGSPVYYAGPNGALCALLDRAFFADGGSLAFKPSAAVVSARRGGTTATFDRLNKYFSMNRMPIVTSQYWNSVHGFSPEDVMQDEEGLQTMRTLGYNMAWMLKSIENGNQPLPEIESWMPTHFIR